MRHQRKTSFFLTPATSWMDGTITIKNDIEPYGHMRDALPRLGLSMILDKSLEQVKWYGRGPAENYIDRCTGSFIGVYESTVTGGITVRPSSIM